MYSSLNHYSINFWANRALAAGDADCNVVPANQKTTQHLEPHLHIFWESKSIKKKFKFKYKFHIIYSDLHLQNLAEVFIHSVF